MKKGFLLNQKGLYNNRTNTKIPIPVNSEQDIFTILGLDYVPPTQRDM